MANSLIDGGSSTVDLDLARRVLEAAARRRLSCATAESCTGGLVGALLTAIPGSSEAYAGGVIAYANEVKINVLGVRPDTLERWGAVSEAVAREMAEGALSCVGADVAVSVTGVAGPGGGTAEKPVGLVCFGLAAPVGTRTTRRHLSGDRAAVRAAAARHALAMLLEALEAGDVPVAPDVLEAVGAPDALKAADPPGDAPVAPDVPST